MKREHKLSVSCLKNKPFLRYKENIPLNVPVHEILNIISNTESKQAGFWDVWSPDFTCVTLFLLLRQTQTMCLFQSADAGQKRWKRFLYSLCSSRNNHSQGDFFLCIKKPLHKPRYSSVSPYSRRVWSSAPSYLQEHDWTDILG